MNRIVAMTALLVGASSLLACGDTERQQDGGSRAIEGVILVSNAEGGDKATLQDPALIESAWFSYDDLGECDNMNKIGETQPPGGDGFFTTDYASAGVTPPAETAGQSSNAYGVRLWGTAHSMWGAGMGFDLAKGQPLNLTEPQRNFVGLRFLGYAPTPQSVKVKLQDVLSVPSGNVCKPRDESLCDDQGCFNAPFTTVQLTPEWKEYRIYFNKTVSDDPNTPAVELGPMAREATWGIANEGAMLDGMPVDDARLRAEPPRIDMAYQIQFETSDGSQDFDIWVDNVGFIVAGGPADTAG